MSTLTSAQRARAIKRALRQVQLDPTNANAAAEFRLLVPELICPNCGDPFDRFRLNQVYCTVRCRNLAGVKRHRKKK